MVSKKELEEKIKYYSNLQNSIGEKPDYAQGYLTALLWVYHN